MEKASGNAGFFCICDLHILSALPLQVRKVEVSFYTTWG